MMTIRKVTAHRNRVAQAVPTTRTVARPVIRHLRTMIRTAMIMQRMEMEMEMQMPAVPQRPDQKSRMSTHIHGVLPPKQRRTLIYSVERRTP